MIIALAMVFLPWVSASGSGDSFTGNDFDEGTFVIIVSLITILLIQAAVRPAWIGAGFVAAIYFRKILDISDEAFVDPGVALWIGFLAALEAVALLIWQILADIRVGASQADSS